MFSANAKLQLFMPSQSFTVLDDCEPQAGECLPKYTTGGGMDNNKLATVYYKHKHKQKHNTMATEGKLMEPGLGTNPRSSGERSRRRVPTRSRTTPDTGCREQRGKERSRKVSQWRPAGLEPVADATDPYRTS